MTIAELTNRMNAAEEKMNKCLATIERHKAQKQKKIDKWNALGVGEYSTLDRNSVRDLYDAGEISNDEYWFFVDIEHKDDDIKGATKKYEEAKQTFKNWQERLGRAEAKEQYINNEVPQVIKDFLDNWKTETYNFMLEMKDNFFKDKADLKEKTNKAIYEYLVAHPYNYETFFKFNKEEADNYNPNYDYGYWVSSYATYKKVKRETLIDMWEQKFNNKYADPLFKMYKSCGFDNEWLDKTLTQEMNSKLLDLMARVTKITGTITDANLYVNKGDLNGNVTGERGIANVYTIEAGGWNVQRLHLRVLVRKIG